jgi:hypothetical protein
MTDTTAKIRVLLPKTIEELENFTLRKSKEALALLSAEERPSVPMAMLDEIVKTSERLEADPKTRGRGDFDEAYRATVARYGFDVKGE